jgi:serine/threonine protein kinase
MNNEAKPELSEVSFPSAPVLSEEGRSFIVKLLDVIPEHRMDMDEALAHPFLKLPKTEV